jgi:hypothetical protein
LTTFFRTVSVVSPVSCVKPSKIKLYFIELYLSLSRYSYNCSFSRTRCFRSSLIQFKRWSIELWCSLPYVEFRCVIFSTMNILNSIFDHSENEMANSCQN